MRRRDRKATALLANTPTKALEKILKWHKKYIFIVCRSRKSLKKFQQADRKNFKSFIFCNLLLKYNDSMIP